MERESEIVLDDFFKPDTLTVGSVTGLLTAWTTPTPLDASLMTFWWLVLAAGKFLFFATTGTIVTALLKAHIEPLVERLPWLKRLKGDK